LPEEPTQKQLTQWHTSLSKLFTASRKPSPTPKQSADAYRSAAPHWDKFLEWMATAPAFEKTQHPGGLPALLQMFEAEMNAEPVQERPKKVNSQMAALDNWAKGKTA
jgi:hypothetical protein